MKNKVSLEHTRTTLVIFLALLVFLIVVCFWVAKPFLLAITMGGILALLEYPVFKKLRDKVVFPRVASALVTIGTLLLVIIPVSVFLTLAFKQGMALAQLASENDKLSVQSVTSHFSNSSLFDMMRTTPEELNVKIHESIQKVGKSAMALALDIAGQIPNIIMQIIMACITCFFLLVDGRRLGLWMKDKIPLDRDIIKRFYTSFKDTAQASVLATFAAGAAQSAIILVGFLVLGVPGVFLAVGVTFIFAWIPILGCGPVWITASIYLYNEGAVFKVVLMVVFGLLASVADNFVRPFVLKGKSNLHFLVSLVAVFGGIRFFGILGVFLGPILAAVTISILQIWPAVAQRFGLMTQDL
ncbi:MAG: AI-2E family transporter [Deltaproteobacteria bacterium]|nr:AI-2E family transporter [Deltaproteobacteria bacterium]